MSEGGMNFIHSLGWAIVNSLWQFAVLWIIYMVYNAINTGIKPFTKSVMANGLLISGFAWFIFTFLSSYLKSPVEKTFFFGTIFSEEQTYPGGILNRGMQLITIVYLVFLIIPILHFIKNYRYVQVIRKYGISKTDVKWRLFVNSIAERMGIKKKVKIWISDFVSSPVTVGFLKPVILLPAAAIFRLSPYQLEAIIMHELSHIRRYDYLFNLIINVIRTILYFNPFVRAFIRIVEMEREKSCDEIVLQFRYNSLEYANALLTLEKETKALKIFAIASGGKRNDLLCRIETILGIQKKSIFSFRTLGLFLFGLVCVIGLNFISFTGNKPYKSDTVVFPHLSSPFAYLSGKEFFSQYHDVKKQPGSITIPSSVAVKENTVLADPDNTLLQENMGKPVVNNLQDNLSIAPTLNIAYQLADQKIEVIPVLDKKENEQIRETLEASRKVLENTQWNILEKKLADVFTTREKDELKSAYREEVNKFNWDKWENKLRLAYENIDWDKVNYQLSNAVNQIKIDSLQKVVNKVLVEINQQQKVLSLLNNKQDIDLHISLKEVEKKKKEALQTLRELKSIRNKKVVHL